MPGTSIPQARAFERPRARAQQLRGRDVPAIGQRGDNPTGVTPMSITRRPAYGLGLLLRRFGQRALGERCRRSACYRQAWVPATGNGSKVRAATVLSGIRATRPAAARSISGDRTGSCALLRGLGPALQPPALAPRRRSRMRATQTPPMPGRARAAASRLRRGKCLRCAAPPQPLRSAVLQSAAAAAHESASAGPVPGGSAAPGGNSDRRRCAAQSADCASALLR